MKTKNLLVVIAALFTLLTFRAAALTETNTTDTTKHRINIRVNNNHQVVFRADLLKGQKKLNYILKVYSEDGEMVYASTFIKKGPIYKVYDMSNLPKGKYSFTVYKMLKPVYNKDVYKSTSPVEGANNEPLLVEEK